MSEVSLTISKDIVNPIVEAKVKEAVLSALGGADKLVDQLVSTIISQKVNEQGKVDSYSHNNKFSWLDVVLTKVIKEQAEEAIKEVLADNAKTIKQELIKQLQTKKGSSLAASALIDAMNGTFSNSWRSQISIDLKPLTND